VEHHGVDVGSDGVVWETVRRVPRCTQSWKAVAVAQRSQRLPYPPHQRVVDACGRAVWRQGACQHREGRARPASRWPSVRRAPCTAARTASRQR